MAKLRLNLEALAVESFETRSGDGLRGTVQGHVELEPEPVPEPGVPAPGESVGGTCYDYSCYRYKTCGGSCPSYATGKCICC